MRDKEMQIRSITSELKTREEQEGLYLEGYFIVFDKETELWPGAFEEIDQKALNKTLDNDIRALVNHDTTLVLGRNKSNTLELKADSKGLWGKIEINPKDTDAVNIYERVRRGDVTGNSFGFNILDETIEHRDDGTVKFILKEIDLHEVSITTFPQYEETSIQARQKDLAQYRQRQLEQRKNNLKERVKTCLNN